MIAITNIGKRKIIAARAGRITLPPIDGMAFGDGGVDSDGNVLEHSKDDTELFHEVLRKKIYDYSRAINFDLNLCEYSCTLTTTELNGVKISEIGIYDTEGDIIAMQSFVPKIKDSTETMSFSVVDKFG